MDVNGESGGGMRSDDDPNLSACCPFAYIALNIIRISGSLFRNLALMEVKIPSFLTAELQRDRWFFMVC